MTWKTITTSLGIQYIGRLAGLFVSLFSVSLLTRYLGIAHFGEYTAAQAIANLVITFSDFGFFWSTVQSYLHHEGKLESIKEILGIRVIATLVLIVVSTIIVLMGNFSTPVKQAYIILGIFIFASSVNNILIALYQAEYKMLWPTIVDLFARAVNLGIILIGMWMHLPLLWFILGISLASFSNLAINWIGLLKRQGPIFPRLRGVSWRKYYDSVALVGLMSLFSALFYKIDVVILSWFKGSVDVGIYGAAQKMVELAIMMQSLFMASLFPLLVSRFKESREAFLAVMRRSIIISAAIGMPLSLYGLLLDTQIINLIGGRQFLTEATVFYNGIPVTTPVVLAILLVFVLISYLSSPYTTGVLASGQVRQLVKVNLLATLFNIGLNLWLIPRYSYFAAAITTLITEVLILGLNGIYFCWRYSFRPPIWDLIKITFATIPGVIFLVYTAQFSIAIRAPLVIVIYAASLSLLMPELRQAIPSLIRSGNKATPSQRIAA